MVAFAPVSAFTGVSVRSANQAVSTRPVPAARVSVQANVHSGAGKGFGGGEATRDPNPTRIDPNDPKGKQKAIHAAEGWAEYQARMKGGSAGSVGRPASSVGSPSASVGRPSSAVGRPSSAVGRPAASAPSPSAGGSGTAATWAEYQAKIAREGGSSAGGAGAGSSWNSSPRGGTVGSSYNSSGAPSSPRSSAPARGGSSFGGGSRAPTSSSLDTLYGPGPGGAGKRGGGSTPASGSAVSTSVSTLYSAGGGASSSRSTGSAPASPRGGTVGSRYASPASSSVHSGAGKGFGGGEATRDPTPTQINPNDPKGKQKAIHQAEGWAEYQARMAREGRR